MKLKFTKNEELEIQVTQVTENNESDFTYLELIKTLIEDKSLEDTLFEGDFIDSEIKSINSMVTLINKEVTDFYEDSDTE